MFNLFKKKQEPVPPDPDYGNLRARLIVKDFDPSRCRKCGAEFNLIRGEPFYKTYQVETDTPKWVCRDCGYSAHTEPKDAVTKV